MMTQNPPEWMFLTILPIALILMMGLLIGGAILEVRYINPYTLIKATNKEKWRSAAILAALQTSMLLIFGLTLPILSTPPEKMPMFLLCNGLWVVAFPIATLYKRWEFESHIKRYRYFDKQIKDKSSVYQRLFIDKFPSGLMKVFMSAEQKRLWNEGFPEDVDEKKDENSSGQELNDN
jgi:hypothetical protein